jgi:dTMP kinase
MKFIVFEGLDGAGKSTLIEALKAEVLTKGQKVTMTREPGGTPLGNDVRNLLLRVNSEPPTARAELLLYEADRAQHVEKVIQPALSRGEWVLSDRYYASTIAFQAGGRELNLDEISWLNKFAVKGCEPDLWVLLDLTTHEAKKRMAGRELDRFENEKSDFHERVRNKYLEIAEKDKKNWLILDASRAKSELIADLFSYLRGRKWL